MTTENYANFTVLGSTGFIGRHLVDHLRATNRSVFAPARTDPSLFSRPLGHVIYAIGVTADFRTKPFETMEAHVSVLGEILQRTEFASFTYLSSTRLYANAASTSETTNISVNPSDPSDLYTLSKLAGEALCLAQPDVRVRIARLSNVFGTDMDAGGVSSQNFLAAVIREAVLDGQITLRTDPKSAKDYICIDDVQRALLEIAINGKERIYNVAAGRNVNHRNITDALAVLTGCNVSVTPGAPMVEFSPIDTDRLTKLFTPSQAPWMPADLLELLPRITSGHLREPIAAGGLG